MAIKKLLSSKKGIITRNDLKEMAKEYYETAEQIKVLEKKKKDLADKIKSSSEKFGTKDDKAGLAPSNGRADRPETGHG